MHDEDDECNLINKDDFDEGKNQDIVTARATPIKHNALAKKNQLTTHESSVPSFPHTFRQGGEDSLSFLHNQPSPLNSDALET